MKKVENPINNSLSLFRETQVILSKIRVKEMLDDLNVSSNQKDFKVATTSELVRGLIHVNCALIKAELEENRLESWLLLRYLGEYLDILHFIFHYKGNGSVDTKLRAFVLYIEVFHESSKNNYVEHAPKENMPTLKEKEYKKCLIQMWGEGKTFKPNSWSGVSHQEIRKRADRFSDIKEPAGIKDLSKLVYKMQSKFAHPTSYMTEILCKTRVSETSPFTELEILESLKFISFTMKDKTFKKIYKNQVDAKDVELLIHKYEEYIRAHL